jgi:putative lysine transport system permease protein
MNNLIFSTVPKMPKEFGKGIQFLLEQYWRMFLTGMFYTILVALVGTIIGLLIAIAIVPFKIQTVSTRDRWLIRFFKRLGIFLTSVYVEVLRGTPMIVQAVIIYYGLAGMGYQMNVIVCGILIVSINTSAYITEVLRGSINAIDKGQLEAARSLGMTRGQAMIHIIIPQALKNSIPAIGNEFVVNIKDTAVLNVISVTELFFMTTRVNSIYYRQVEGFMITAALYLIMTFATTRLLYFVGSKIGVKNKSYPTSQSA